MRLTYKLEKEDYYAFNFEQMKNIPRIRRNINVQRFLIPVVFTLLAIGLARLSGRPIRLLSPLYIFLVVGWVIIYPQILRKSISQRLNRVLNSEDNKMLFDERTIELNDQGLYAVVERDGSEELVLAAEKVEKMEENAQYIYVFLSSQSVYIIPKKFFAGPDEILDFKNQLGLIIQESL